MVTRLRRWWVGVVKSLAALVQRRPSQTVVGSQPGSNIRAGKGGARATEHLHNCRQCGRSLVCRSCNHRKWCDRSCRYLAHKPAPEPRAERVEPAPKPPHLFQCVVCGKVGTTRTNGKSAARYCSQSCRFGSQPAHEGTCLQCGKTWSTFSRKARFCSSRCGDRYRRRHAHV
jgi:hypothetical protein